MRSSSSVTRAFRFRVRSAIRRNSATKTSLHIESHHGPGTCRHPNASKSADLDALPPGPSGACYTLERDRRTPPRRRREALHGADSRERARTMLAREYACIWARHGRNGGPARRGPTHLHQRSASAAMPTKAVPEVAIPKLAETPAPSSSLRLSPEPSLSPCEGSRGQRGARAERGRHRFSREPSLR